MGSFIADSVLVSGTRMPCLRVIKRFRFFVDIPVLYGLGKEEECRSLTHRAHGFEHQYALVFLWVFSLLTTRSTSTRMC